MQEIEDKENCPPKRKLSATATDRKNEPKKLKSQQNPPSTSHAFFPSQQTSERKVLFRDMINRKENAIEQYPALLSLLKEKGYQNDFIERKKDDDSPVTIENRIDYVYNRARLHKDLLPPEGFDLISYVCKDPKDNHFAFVVADLSKTKLSEKKLKACSKWHSNKFQFIPGKLEHDEDKALECIFIFKLPAPHTPESEKKYLTKIGEILCTKGIDFPCRFIISFGCHLSEIYTQKDAKKVYQKSQDGIEKYLVAAPSIVELNSQYMELLENVISFQENNLLLQTIQEEDTEFHKEIFSPDQFFETQRYYTNLLRKLEVLRNTAALCKHDKINVLVTDINQFINDTQITLNQLLKIRQEYIGNEQKEKELRKQWETIKNNPLLKDYLPKGSEQWFENHIFIVLTRMKEIEAEKTPPILKEDYCQKLGYIITQDFYAYPGNSNAIPMILS